MKVRLSTPESATFSRLVGRAQGPRRGLTYGRDRPYLNARGPETESHGAALGRKQTVRNLMWQR